MHGKQRHEIRPAGLSECDPDTEDCSCPARVNVAAYQGRGDDNSQELTGPLRSAGNSSAPLSRADPLFTVWLEFTAGDEREELSFCANEEGILQGCLLGPLRDPFMGAIRRSGLCDFSSISLIHIFTRLF